MNAASLYQGRLPRIEANSEKKRHFNEILFAGLFFIQLA